MEFREYRAESVKADDEGTISGLVTPFNRETTVGNLEHGGWKEEVANGTFTKTLREGDALMVYNHDLTRPLARQSAGNLELRELDNHGLVVKANPADTSYARDLRELIRSGVIQGMSFGFHAVKDEWRDANGKPSDKYSGTKRILREVKLIEVSPVTKPAYGGTSIMVRDESSALLEKRAAAATYSDLQTCGECGAGGQYGDYCTGCGEPMADSHPSGSFCASCGNAVDADAREAHVCDESRAKKPYGNVPYADPKNGKYPIDRAHVKAAWAYICQAKNAAKYPLNGVTLASVKARIKAAMKKFGHTSGTAGETKNFDEWFVSTEWRDDDPYFDDFYEIDFDESEEQEPDSSTPDSEDDLPLRMAMRSREIELAG